MKTAEESINCGVATVGVARWAQLAHLHLRALDDEALVCETRHHHRLHPPPQLEDLSILLECVKIKKPSLHHIFSTITIMAYSNYRNPYVEYPRFVIRNFGVRQIGTFGEAKSR